MPELKISNDLQNVIKKVVLDTYFPVGKIYITLGNENPSETIGGEWEKIKGRFLLGTGVSDGNTDNFFGAMSGTTYNAGLGTLGGQDYHTLTTEEMPNHNHTGTAYGIGSGGYNATDPKLVYKDNTNTTWVAEGLNWFNSTGGGAKHNNMPPYLAVNMWKRTA